MDYVRTALPAHIVEQFIPLPASLKGRSLEVIVLPDTKSIASQLRGCAETDLTLDEARTERLRKYEAAT